MNPCGAMLDQCRCRGLSIAPRTRDEIDAAHRAAVARARRSGFADDLVPGWVIAILLPSAMWDEKAA